VQTNDDEVNRSAATLGSSQRKAGRQSLNLIAMIHFPIELRNNNLKHNSDDLVSIFLNQEDIFPVISVFTVFFSARPFF